MLCCGFVVLGFVLAVVVCMCVHGCGGDLVFSVRICQRRRYWGGGFHCKSRGPPFAHPPTPSPPRDHKNMSPCRHCPPTHPPKKRIKITFSVSPRPQAALFPGWPHCHKQQWVLSCEHPQQRGEVAWPSGVRLGVRCFGAIAGQVTTV